MLRAIPRFLMSLLLGLCLGIAALALAGYLNIWKQTWQASFTIVEEVFDQQNNHPVTGLTAPLALLPIPYTSSPKRLYLDHQSSSDDRYIPTETFVKTTTDVMSAIVNSSTDQAKQAHPLLQKLKATTLACPGVETVYWDDCYGTFKAPWNVTYEGIWEEDKLTGFGTSINLTSGEIYIGEFINNMYDGCGKLTSENGVVELGIWKKNVLRRSDDACLPAERE